MINITKHKDNHYELHLGAYFRGFISTMAGFFSVILTVAILIILAKGLIAEPGMRFFTVVLLAVVLGIFINIFLGFEGVEFDVDKKLFRKYVKRVGLKMGEWKSLEPYTMLCLSAQYNRMGRSPLTASDNGKHRSLEINLASLTQKSILLAECKNYKHAEQTLNQLNDFLKLEIKNFVLEGYTKPKPRR